MQNIIYGFTGTRTGLNKNQIKSIKELLNKNISDGYNICVHHGDCIGADKEFHDLVRDISKEIKIIIHPPNNNILRAYCKSEFIEKTKPYLERNKNIVIVADTLIACPYSNEEQIRSGTWSTIRYAKKVNKNILLFT